MTVKMDAAADPGMGRPTADCCVTDVKPGGQAARVGIKEGWKMVAVNGVAVSSLMDFGREMNAAKQNGAGQETIMVDLTLDTNGVAPPAACKSSSSNSTIAEIPAFKPVPKDKEANNGRVKSRAIAEIPAFNGGGDADGTDKGPSASANDRFTVKMDAAADPGMGRPTVDCCVTDVKPRGQAARVGIKEGWKMVAVNGVAVSSLMDFGREMNAAKQNGAGKKRIMVDLTIEKIGGAESEPEEPFTPHDEMRPGWDEPLDHIAG